MSSFPTVSIIMATYNRAHFIVETLLSIQNQSFKDWECIIIDDGGTDTTKEVIKSIVENDKRFTFKHKTEKHKKGLPGCRNYGLDIAQGDYVIFFDDDDYIHPQNLEICVNVLKDTSIDFCHYQKQSYCIEKPNIQLDPKVLSKLLSINQIEEIVTQKIGLASCTVMWKKKCFHSNRFNEELLYAEEWECYTRIISEGIKGVILDTILYYNRKHPESNTGEFIRKSGIRRKSYTTAILLVITNLKEKKLLSTILKQYFITISRDFSEYHLFESILSLMELPTFEKLKWYFFYHTFPMRLSVYKLKNKYKSNK